MSNKTIMITGAGGFLGSTLISILAKLEYNLIIYTSQKDKFAQLSSDKYKVYNESDWINNLIKFEDVDVCFNCAFSRSSESSKIVESIAFTDSFISDAVDNGTKKIINISSQSVYSQQKEYAANEKTPINPESFYALAKYSTETIISRICIDKGIPYTNVRLGSLVGTKLESRLTNRFVKQAIVGEDLIVAGNKQIISYLHVIDAAEALISMINDTCATLEPIYNLGSEEYLAIDEIAIIVKEIALIKLNKIIDIKHKEGGNAYNNTLDSSLFYNQFSWVPKWNARKIVEELFNHYLHI